MVMKRIIRMQKFQGLLKGFAAGRNDSISEIIFHKRVNLFHYLSVSDRRK